MNFIYDALDRLDYVSGAFSEDYSYDGEGRLSSKTGLGTYTYASGHFHGASSTGSGNSYVYDNNGNMTQRNTTGGNFTLSYDVENRLTGVSGAASATFAYDGDGNRVKATVDPTTTYYVGDYYEIQGSTVRKYYYAGGQRVAMNENGTVYWLLSDHLSSTAITASSGGGKTGELRYYPFGSERYNWGNMPTTYRFTGQRACQVKR